MSVLFRIVAALLIAVPAFLVLVIVFALAGRRRTPLPAESYPAWKPGVPTIPLDALALRK